MNVVIDAQIVGWYFAELGGASVPATSSPAALIDSLGDVDVAFLDDQLNIEAEWRNTTDPDLFEQWYFDLLAGGGAVIIPVATAKELIRQLHKKCGFPYSRDVWYVRTAVAAAEATTAPTAILSEDLDFYEPTVKKSCTPKRRMRIITDGTGKVAAFVRRKADIEVRSIATHYAT